MHTHTNLYSVKLHAQLAKELQYFAWSMEKTQTVCDTTARDLDRFEHHYDQQGETIEQVKQEIASLKDQLQQAKQKRKHKEHYHVLAKTVNELPSRTQSQKYSLFYILISYLYHMQLIL